MDITGANTNIRNINMTSESNSSQRIIAPDPAKVAQQEARRRTAIDNLRTSLSNRAGHRDGLKEKITEMTLNARSNKTQRMSAGRNWKGNSK